MPSLFQQLRTLPRAAWILFGGTFINRFGTFVMPFLILYLKEIGYSTIQAGLAVGAYGAGHIVASASGGHLADRLGRRNTIALSMFGSAAAMLALSQARGFAWIVAFTCITGAFAELYRPASHALLTDLVRPEQRTLSFGMYRFAVNLGFAAGPATAGFLAEHSFFFLFAGDAITSVLYGVIALFALPQGLRTYLQGERTGGAIRVALRDRPFVIFLLASVCIATVDFQMGSTLPLYITSLGFTPRIYGLLISANGVMIILFELLITNSTQRLRARPVIAIGFLLAGTGFALTGLARTVPALLATVVVWTVGEMISSPLAAAYVAELAPERYRGRYMGLFVLSWSIGMLVGPLLGTWAFAHNRTLLWGGCGLLGAVAASLLLLSSPKSPAA